MGRLLKKKPAYKKGKKQEIEKLPVGSGETRLEQKSVPEKSPESKKKTVIAPKKVVAPPKPTEAGGLRKWIGDTRQFLREVKAELKKVTWPTKKQTMGSTLVVIILVMVVSSFLGAVDMGLSALVRVVLQ